MGTYVRSVTQSWFSAVAVKFRFTRSVARVASGSGRVVNTLRRRGYPLDTELPHEPGHLVPADVVAGPPGCLPQLVGAIDLAVGDSTARTCIITASRKARAEGATWRCLAA